MTDASTSSDGALSGLATAGAPRSSEGVLGGLAASDARVSSVAAAHSSSVGPSNAVADSSPGPARLAVRLLALYAAVLALIAFWPTPVDRDAAGLLREIARVVPLLTYDVVEFTANVMLFVPLGVLLSFALPHRRGLVVPIAVVVTLVIESCQALFLAERTPSLRDIVANTLGAVVGLLVVHLVERRAASRRRAGSRGSAVSAASASSPVAPTTTRG